MVRAILEGCKTQTRRIVKPQPIEHNGVCEYGPAIAGSMHALHQWMISNKCPYGKPGDRLWVRETWGKVHYEGVDPDPTYFYRADETDPEKNALIRWRPSIHMPRWASRIILEVVSVRVERLQGISEEDAKAEGIPEECANISIDTFAALWQSINGPGSWEANPWVWVVEFGPVGQWCN